MGYHGDLDKHPTHEPGADREADWPGVARVSGPALYSGGNFAGVGLMLAACDALGDLRYGTRSSGDRILERCLPDAWKPAASVLYDALRNGLLHGYEPKIVMRDGAAVGFAIGWRSSVGHMQFTNEARDAFYVCAPSLVATRVRV
jgi:hypothetical protein